jgi:hypothetical protein
MGMTLDIIRMAATRYMLKRAPLWWDEVESEGAGALGRREILGGYAGMTTGGSSSRGSFSI